jgi:hypothetical protein
MSADPFRHESPFDPPPANPNQFSTDVATGPDAVPLDPLTEQVAEALATLSRPERSVTAMPPRPVRSNTSAR